MLVVAFVSFSLFTFVGDPINNMVGEETSEKERAELRVTLGLNDPIPVQFVRFNLVFLTNLEDLYQN